ncbi:MAG: peptidoglycan-binding protein [Erysipelotrichaceae bacterium]|nr:peptidoglycan-binding protein [Erysipelotrichaceae bacterium]
MSEENKVYVKLQRQPLESERQEIRSRKRRRLLLFLLCVFLFLLGFFGGFFFGHRAPDFPETASGKLEEIKYYLKNVWLFGDDYEDLDTMLNDQAFYGMTTFPEDPYTTYMSSEELDSFSSGINMNYVGIGIQYTVYDGVPTVTRVFRGSPAEQAGMREGDILLKADGTPLEGLETDEIREIVIGEEKTPVVMTIQRGADTIDLTILRGAIDYTVYAYTDKDCVIMEIMSFGESTADECVRYLEPYRDYHKLIIDLRDNSGGYQTSVQEVAGVFLGKDVVVMDQIFKNGRRESYKTISHEYFDNFDKIVVLTNQYTASAAEVLAICLKEQHPDTTLVGLTTYGKGVVQSTYLIDDGNSALKITTSKWLSPSGKWINGEGVHPDVEVYQDDALYISYASMEEGDLYAVDQVSEVIEAAEKALSFLGYDMRRTDGYFDGSMTANLLLFQKENGLPETGNLDPDTYYAILSRLVYVNATDPSKDLQMVEAKKILNK